MGQNELLIGLAAAAGAVVAYAGNVGGFKAWADNLMKGGGAPPGNVSTSCDQLCANGACGTFKVYCKGTCPKCAAQQNLVTQCLNTCRAKGLLGGFSNGKCICTTPPRPYPLGKCYPHPTVLGGLCYRNKCGAKEVSWCAKATCPTVTAGWKQYACKTAAHAYGYAGFDNVTIA